MSRKRLTFRKKGIASIAVAGAACLATFGLSGTSLFQSFGVKTADLQFQVRGTIPTGDIVILAIDQKSLDAFPEPRIFWHRYYAEAIRAAAAGGARVMALDVVFLIPVAQWEPENDQALAEGIASNAGQTPVVCGYIPSQTAMQQQRPIPENMIASALGLAGYVNFTVDSDDFVRRQELLEAGGRSGEARARSLALRVAEKYLRTDAELTRGKLTLAGKPIPVDADRAIRINFAGPPETFPRISFADFIAASRAGHQEQIRRWVGGKIALIGVDFVDDRYPTPYFSLRSGRNWNTPGVEIHASTIQTLLNRDFLVPVPGWADGLAIVLAGVIASVIAIYLPMGRAIASNALFVVSALAASHAAFRAGMLTPVLEIPVVAAASTLFASVYLFLAADERRRFLRQAITIFVGGRVATSLEAAGEISMAGARATVSILFSDIRGFTAFCDGQDPVTVVSLLNVYFSTMVSIITSHSGQVNKFIGDGILAIFSDDDGPGLPDHAVRAVRCGMAMNAAELPPFKTGVGIHTGPVVIGNIGSSEKLEYTPLGDTVNLASRLESMNKEKHTELLMSGTTYERLGGIVKSRLIGSIPIRGKNVPVELYTVVSEELEEAVAPGVIA